MSADISLRLSCRFLLAGLALLAASAGKAQTADSADNPIPQDAATRYGGSYWAQVYPNRDFQRGCVIGYLAFEFSPTGYFIFNRKVTGSWRVDELGNLRLRTRDGARLLLTVTNDMLMPTSNLGLIKRANLYQKCPQ
jgi:hypothetical protein